MSEVISDVLTDAIAEIERYQQQHPEAYDDLSGDIGRCKEAMRKLLRALDR